MESLIERLSDSARAGVFGPGRLLRVENNDDTGLGAQFASQIYFFRVVLEDEQSVKNVPVVVKVQIENIEDIAKENGEPYRQFLNEVNMYKTVLPELLSDQRSYPKMFLAEASGGTDITKDILVLEDLRERGYKIADDLFLDFDHMSLAMRRLGEFHGSSYRLKIDNPELMGVWRKTLLESKKQLDDSEKAFFDSAVARGFGKFLTAGKKYSGCRIAYEKLIGIPTEERLKVFCRAEEPFASIVHGDFNKNNILFKYDHRGKTEDVLFFDFATSIYSDPSIDLSFILYMNTSAAERDAHWEEYLSIYWAGLTSVCPYPRFSFKQFLDNFSKKAIYGYLHCAFFLPMMLFECDLKKFNLWTIEEKIEFASNHGGAEATEMISKIVGHLLEKGYLEQFLRLNTVTNFV